MKKKKKVCNGHVTVARGGGGGVGRGPTGPPLCARRARHSRPVRSVILGSFDSLSLDPFGPPSGPVRPAQYKARGLAAGLKKI